MKVSILLPVYNGERFLEKSIQSVLNQSFKDFEFIIVNDGSTDNTVSIVHSFNDKRIKFLSLEKNYGICFALNKGLEICQGEYIARMDSDDIWLEEKLAKQVQYLDMIQSMDLCFTFAGLMDEDGYEGDTRYHEQSQLYHSCFDSQKEIFERLLFHENFLVHPSVLIRRSAFEEVGMYYNSCCGKSQDVELWIRFLLNQSAIGMLEEELMYFRWLPHLGLNDRFPSKKTNTQRINEQYYIIKKAFGNISNELFTKWYKNDFAKEEATTLLEMDIEKSFLLLKKNSIYNLMPCAIYFFEKVLETREGEKLLIEEYNFPLKDFYRLYQSHLYYDNVIQEEYEVMGKKIENLDRDLNITIDYYENSLAGKVTNVLSSIKDKFK